MIVLDTTVLVYATGAGHSLRDPCRALIDAVADGMVRATTTVEVIQEFTHVRARRRDRAEASRLARSFVDLLAPLLSVGQTTLLHGLELHGTSRRLGPFDAVLAASALHAGAEALVSADVSFADVSELRHVVPTAEGVTALLQRTP